MRYCISNRSFLLFGQRLRREPEETKSCRTGGICTSVRPSVRTYVRTSVRTSVPPPGSSEAGPGLSGVGPGLSEPVLPAQGQPLRGLGQPLRGLRGGGMDGRRDGQTDGRTDVQIPPILQDFVSSGSLRSRCPAHITATITEY